jgi:hypothetical protein
MELDERLKGLRSDVCLDGRENDQSVNCSYESAKIRSWKDLNAETPQGSEKTES